MKPQIGRLVTSTDKNLMNGRNSYLPRVRQTYPHGEMAWHEDGDPQQPALLLLHGVGLNADSWGLQLPTLVSHYHVYALDMPGHGDSGLLAGRPALADFVQALHCFIVEVVKKRVLLVGHSMGALLALSYAAAHPEQVRAVATLNAVYQRPADARQQVLARARELQMTDPEQVLARPLQRWFGDNPQGQDKQLAEQVGQWLDGVNRAGYLAAYRVFAECDGIEPAQLERLACPVLFMTGELDANSSPAMSRALAAATSQGSALVLEGQRHMMMLTAAAAVNSALSAFLQQASQTQE